MRVGGGPPSADVASLDVKLAQECFAKAGLNKETFWGGQMTRSLQEKGRRVRERQEEEKKRRH